MVFSKYHLISHLIEKILTLLILIVSFCSHSFAFNHPEIQWKTVETKNFLIHYNDKTRPAVFAAWKIAEEALNACKSLYNFETTPKINMVLADYDDYSNGYAAWTKRSIMIWIPDNHFDFRSNTTWLRNVITHELAHIMSLDKKSRMQIMDWTFQTQYISPNVKFNYQWPLAFSTFFPHWFTEGTAQLRTEELGSDCWDSRRSMVFRCAILDGRLLTLEEMGHFNHTALGNELVYNQGYLFVKFLEHRIGKEEIASLWNSCRRNKLFGTNLDKYFIRNFKMPLDSLYNVWKDSMYTIAESLLPTTSTTVRTVWEHGTINKEPQFSYDFKYIGWLTNHRDDFLRTDLVIFKNGEEKPVIRLKYAKESWAFSPDGNTVYYIKSRKPDVHGSFFNDLFAYNLSTGKETRLTKSARIYDVAVSSDGKDLFCVQYYKNTYRLIAYSLSGSQITSIVHGVFGEPILNTSAINSDSSRLIFSKIIYGKSGIFILDKNTGKMNPIVNSEFQEENPYYARNGRIYFNADYDGIFNIYSILPDGTDLNRHTNVKGGAFFPILGKNDTLLFTEYTSKGFRISKCKSIGIPYQIQVENTCYFKPVPYPAGTVRINSELYLKKYLKPVWELYTTLLLKDQDRAFQDRVKIGEVSNSPWKISFDFITEVSMKKSDAIEQKKMHLGGALMLNTVWESYKGENKHGKYHNNVFGISNDIYIKNDNILRTNRERKEYHENYGFAASLIKNVYDKYSRNKNTYSDSSLTDSSNIIIHSFLIPFFGIESSLMKPTIGMNSQAFLLLFIPAIINLEPFAEWHIARDVYMGLKSQITLYPLSIFHNFESGYYINIPVWIRWDIEKYNNEDILYHSKGKASYGAYMGVEIEPIEYIKNNRISPDSIISDTTFKSVTSFICGIEINNSFPISKYTSLKVLTENYGAKYNKNVFNTFNEKDTVYHNLLISSLNQVEFIFPIVRNINRGKVYADNIYGNLFYQLDFLGSDEFISNPELSLFTDKNYSSKNASLSHKIGLGIEFGLIRNFVFERKFELKTAWDIFNEEINVDVSVKF